MLGSRCTLGLRCGTERALDLKLVISWRGRAQLVSEQQPRVWRGGDDVPSVERGVKILGTPLVSTPAQGGSRTPNRSCWTAFLTFQTCSRPGLYCCTARLPVQTTSTDVVPPELSQEFANSHDEALWRCLSAVLGVPPTLCNPRVRDTITLPLAFGWDGIAERESDGHSIVLGELGLTH